MLQLIFKFPLPCHWLPFPMFLCFLCWTMGLYSYVQTGNTHIKYTYLGILVSWVSSLAWVYCAAAYTEVPTQRWEPCGDSLTDCQVILEERQYAFTSQLLEGKCQLLGCQPEINSSNCVFETDVPFLESIMTVTCQAYLKHGCWTQFRGISIRDIHLISEPCGGLGER